MNRPIIWLLSILAASATLAWASDAPAPKRFSVEDVRSDFRELYERLQASHFDLYARRPKSDYDALFQSTLAGLDRPLTEVEIQASFQRFMAFGRVAHSRIDFPYDAYEAYRQGGGRSMPLTVRIVQGRVYILDNNSGVAALTPGAEIVGLNGQPIATWLTRLAADISADNDYMMETILERRWSSLLWLELGEVAQFALTVRTPHGEETVAVPARTRAEIKAASDAQNQTLSLDWDKREFRMVGGVGYLRPGPFYNNDPKATNIWDAALFRQFIDDAFGKLLQANAKSLVIDLRDNPGGDNSFSDTMVAWFATKPFRFASAFKIKVSAAAIESNRKRLAVPPQELDPISQKLAAAYAAHRIGDVFSFEIPEALPRPGTRFAGKVYLLINRHSYSNTVQVAALAQDNRFATILGEETSDLATTYGAMEQFTLSRTGTLVGFPKAMIIRANGNLAPRGVVPDIAIPTPIVEDRTDPVLSHALEIAGGKP